MLQMGLLVKIKMEKKKYTIDGILSSASLIIPKNPYFLNMSTTSLPSLQLLSLASFYYLNVGDISAIYG
ncbi:CGH_1_HP_G0099330.mRNA.1.CDS.1 [Saccharomyces cerevisiae]|nr:CGH_1_HP_G0099330.mRNA.1.CDS.1 [Saccharomyces cerevisiae]CAI6946111.1 CGH_1_HP_G0099330.mRNA.1.CDS.1 [Saccharomyces cerevisiae]